MIACFFRGVNGKAVPGKRYLCGSFPACVGMFVPERASGGKGFYWNATMKKLISSLLLLNASFAVAQQQPNFVIFFVDDLGWADLGYQNPQFHTPNIDRLRSEGLYYSRAYVSTATSSPSRASLLTGKEALRCGFVRHIYGNAGGAEFETLPQDPGHLKSRAWLPLEEVTYAERLKELGYYNQHVGKWHLGTEEFFPVRQGFDAMYGTCEHGNPRCFYPPFFRVHDPFPYFR